jgi:hypothetical protein
MNMFCVSGCLACSIVFWRSSKTYFNKLWMAYCTLAMVGMAFLYVMLIAGTDALVPAAIAAAMPWAAIIPIGGGTLAWLTAGAVLVFERRKAISREFQLD